MIHQHLPAGSGPNADDATWAALMAGLRDRIASHGCASFVDGIARLGFSDVCVERIDNLSARLRAACGWTLVAVDALLPELEFYSLLAKKVFPVAHQMRRPEELQFSILPDMFHDALGHLPLLLDPVYSDFLAKYADVALRHLHEPDSLRRLSRIYWYTIEAGLVREGDAIRIIGAAIATSESESRHAMAEGEHRAPFDTQAVFETDYDSFHLQPRYFVLDSFASLSTIASGLEEALLFAAARARDAYAGRDAEPIPAKS
jgi:phenylalanine-4-hydroxylase